MHAFGTDASVETDSKPLQKKEKPEDIMSEQRFFVKAPTQQTSRRSERRVFSLTMETHFGGESEKISAAVLAGLSTVFH
ncbi:MAG TPA: hypothetical protein VFG95_03740 [Nitrospiria bacterium]|nr:hypothetical protein [Nitrospiria bacterium]